MQRNLVPCHSLQNLEVLGLNYFQVILHLKYYVLTNCRAECNIKYYFLNVQNVEYAFRVWTCKNDKQYFCLLCFTFHFIVGSTLCDSIGKLSFKNIVQL
jgi:hypothetical protein